jgi:D-arabinose 1-dehydrogenase-like Zn-dependent alcohol dehydrogenase
MSETPESGKAIPEMMRAAACDGFGGPEVLLLHKLKTPELDRGEVLIEIDTAGVGVWDAEAPAGEIPSKISLFRSCCVGTAKRALLLACC